MPLGPGADPWFPESSLCGGGRGGGWRHQHSGADGKCRELKEELGDLLLQVVMHAQIAKEEGLFTLEDVMRGITDKMIRRHPHVFGTTAVSGSDEVLVNWAEIKKQEKEGKEWMESYLPGAFDEAEELIGAARKRKGFR